MNKPYTKILDVRRDGAVQIVRLTNEETRNSLSNPMRVALARALQQAAEDDGVRALYLTGSGSTFCSGGDLNAFKEGPNKPWDVHRRFRSLRAWLVPFLYFEKPVVVGLNGYAVGGGMGLALAGDILIAAQSAKLMSGFFRLGVIPDVAMMYTLPRLIGLARAKNFLFSNATLTAQQALEIGLVSEVVADDRLDEACLAKAHQLAAGPTQVIGLAKLLMARSFETDVDDMFLLEGLGQSLAMSGEEFREGLNALLEKRPASFARKRAPTQPTTSGGKPKGVTRR
ncbi:MAG: enoyl-CoA hydratase/isomerase family protein [Betaproteobacteria bacterium]|nr:enoyl-CoA hydratase/isomerase family protein [Betaproteobacteria bacterium]